MVTVTPVIFLFLNRVKLLIQAMQAKQIPCQVGLLNDCLLGHILARNRRKVEKRVEQLAR